MESTAKLHRTSNQLEQTSNNCAIEGESFGGSERLFCSTFEQAAIGMAHVAIDGKFMTVNQRLGSILGYDRCELRELSFYNISLPEDREFDLENIRLLLAGEMEIFSTKEKRFRRKDGSLLWGTFTLSVVKNFDGAPNYFILVVEDTSERRKLEEERDRILNLSQDLICIAGMDGYFKYLNPAWEKTLGYATSEMLERPFLDFIHPDDHQKNDREVARLIASNKTINFENRLIAKNGSFHSIHWTVTPLAAERRMYGIGRDITDRKKTLEALRRERDFSKSLIDTAQTIIMVLNPDGTIRSINPYMEEVCGYTLEEVRGKDWCESFLPNQDRQRTRELFGKAINADQTKGNIIPIITKDGRKISIEWYDKTLKDSSGNVVGLLSTGQDVTRRLQVEKEKKEMEARLRQAQKMEAIGTLAGGIAHDFNNILAAILGYTEMVLDGLKPGSPLWDKQMQVLKAGNRAADLVKQILTFSRQTENERKPLQIHFIVKEALKLLRASIPATIEICQDVITSGDSVLADSTEIHQIIMNLSTNAYHAMRETGGVLTVKLHQTELIKGDDKVAAVRLDPGPYLTLTVSDTGHGMDQKTLERIFDPYFTTKKQGEGTGMGLAVVHGIVKSLGGHISVASEPGKGASFTVYLPRIVASAKKVEGMSKCDIPQGAERIMVIDDEEGIVNLQKQHLEQLGYKVTTFTSGKEALETFSADPTSFDLVITDLAMPRMTGIELGRRILTIRPDIPIIMCSGFCDAMDRSKAQSIGIREYLMKPIVRSDMARMLRKLLDKNDNSATLMR